MKSFNLKICKYRYQILLLTLVFGTTMFCYGQSKPQKTDLFYSKIVTLKPNLTKEEVKKIMGEPYKISFTTNEKQEFIEDLYYKILNTTDKWTVITYQCVFVNSKLVSLLQKEIPYSSAEVTVSD